ncbi:hypothetical protein M758_10G115100 [Ceratodon purpureus]|nr:hypothetical protein M758_10G115100 [Ceratodon purpureus]
MTSSLNLVSIRRQGTSFSCPQPPKLSSTKAYKSPTPGHSCKLEHDRRLKNSMLVSFEPRPLMVFTAAHPTKETSRNDVSMLKPGSLSPLKPSRTRTWSFLKLPISSRSGGGVW